MLQQNHVSTVKTLQYIAVFLLVLFTSKIITMYYLLILLTSIIYYILFTSTFY